MTEALGEAQGLEIRPMLAGDSPHVRLLLDQLGYPLVLDEVERRYQAIVKSQDHCVMVALLGGHLVGLVHIYARPALEKPPEAIVQALVVDVGVRKTGIGRRLMSAAERWAADQGYSSVALSSNVNRGDAHRFYEHLGYKRISVSGLFRKGI